MKLILRKNDSATSLLLFLFNNYYAKTAKDSIKLTALLEILKNFDKNETAIRMSLSRAVKSGLLANAKQAGETVYTLSQPGKESIELWNEGVMSFWKRYRLRNLPWDRKWYFVNMEFSDDRKQRAEVADKLQQSGFAYMNTNTWICAYHQKEEINEIIEKYSLEKNVIEITGEMTVRKDMCQFIEDIFKIEDLRARYGEFIHVFGEKFAQTKEMLNRDGYLDGGKMLALLNELGWQFFDIASDDAVLPKEILPEWEGDQAAAIMNGFREILMAAIGQYLEQFD